MENTNLFDTVDQSQNDFVRKFYEINARKNADEKWLKENRAKIRELVGDKGAGDFGNIRVKVTVPNTSKFDMEKVHQFLILKHLEDNATKKVVDEDKLMELVKVGTIDLEELQAFAWVESQGAPRVTIKEI